MERMQKRGLSDVVTTVLIILLVLAAVAIIASYVLNVVNKGSSEVGGAAACTLMQLYPTECKYARAGDPTASPPVPYTYTYTVKATKRGSDIAVKSIDLLFVDSVSKDVKKIPAADPKLPKFLETSAVYTSAAIPDLYSSVSLAVTVVPEGGAATSTCVPSKIVDCVMTPTP